MPATQRRISRIATIYVLIRTLLACLRILYEPIDKQQREEAWKLASPERRQEAYERIDGRMSRRGRTKTGTEILFGLLFGGAIALLLGIEENRKPVATGLILAVIFIVPRFGQLFPRRREDEFTEALGHDRVTRKIKDDDKLQWESYSELISRSHKQRSELRLIAWGLASLLIGLIVSLLPIAL